MRREDFYLVDSLGPSEELLLINPKDKIVLFSCATEDDYEVWFVINYLGHEDMMRDVFDKKTDLRKLMQTCKYKLAYRYYDNYDEIVPKPSESIFGYEIPKQGSYIDYSTMTDEDLEELRSQL